LIGGWVDPRVDLDDVEKRKFLTLPGLELQPVASRRKVGQNRINKKLLLHAEFLQFASVFKNVNQLLLQLVGEGRSFRNSSKASNIRHVLPAVRHYDRCAASVHEHDLEAAQGPVIPSSYRVWNFIIPNMWAISGIQLTFFIYLFTVTFL
jgi:hypothetical protein